MCLSGTTCLSFHGLMFQWANIIKIKLIIDCNLFKIVVQHICFVKGRGTCSSREKNVKILLVFRKSPRFSLTSPSSQLREKSSRPVLSVMSPGICLVQSGYHHHHIEYNFLSPRHIAKKKTAINHIFHFWTYLNNDWCQVLCLYRSYFINLIGNVWKLNNEKKHIHLMNNLE